MEKPTSTSIRVLVIDDHPALRAGVVSIINGQPDMNVVAEGGDGAQSVSLYREHRPDVVLMDLQMPGMGGLEALKLLRTQFDDARVLMLTIYAGDEDIFQCLQAGARGYLLKGAFGTEIIQAIRDVYQGQRHIGPTVGGRLAEHVEGNALTPREREILQLLAEGQENKEIAATLAISVGTVKWHVVTILSKLGVDDRTKAVVTAIRRGLVKVV